MEVSRDPGHQMAVTWNVRLHLRLQDRMTLYRQFI